MPSNYTRAIPSLKRNNESSSQFQIRNSKFKFGNESNFQRDEGKAQFFSHTNIIVGCFQIQNFFPSASAHVVVRKQEYHRLLGRKTKEERRRRKKNRERKEEREGGEEENDGVERGESLKQLEAKSGVFFVRRANDGLDRDDAAGVRFLARALELLPNVSTYVLTAR